MTRSIGISATNSNPTFPVSVALAEEEAWPYYAEDEIAAVEKVLRSGRVNQWTSDTVFAFEAECTRRFGGGHGIALANGSLALELALRAFGIGEGDEVIVTPRTFVASAFCVQLVGATPVFADVDPDSGNIHAASIEAVVTDRTKAIIPVHLAGWPIEMSEIMELAKGHDLKVIEDCAQAQGAMIDNRPVGSFGDAAAFSFCQDKIISTGGEGGFTSFKDPDLWNWAWSFKDHGKNREKVFAPQLRPGFRWLHDNVGTNWRLTAMQAAIGLKQLEKLDLWKGIRTRNAAIWTGALEGISGIRVPHPRVGMEHAFYKHYFYLEPRPDVGKLRDEILLQATQAGLRVFSGSCSEIYLEKAFDGLPRPDLPIARAMSETSLMVEVHPTLKPESLRLRSEILANIIRSVLA